MLYISGLACYNLYSPHACTKPERSISCNLWWDFWDYNNNNNDDDDNPPMPPHVLFRLHGPPPGYGWIVTDFWSWKTQQARLCCPDENDGEMRGESEVPGGALNLISTNYPDHGHHGRLPLSRKNTHGRAGNRTRDLMVSSQELWPTNHEAGLIMMMMMIIIIII